MYTFDPSTPHGKKGKQLELWDIDLFIYSSFALLVKTVYLASNAGPVNWYTGGDNQKSVEEHLITFQSTDCFE